MIQQVRSIGVVSCARVLAILYGALGLLIGACLSLFFLIVSVAGNSSGMPPQMRGGALSLLIGVGSIVFFPVFYGLIGAVGGLIMAGLYNLVAKYVGGIDVEIG